MSVLRVGMAAGALDVERRLEEAGMLEAAGLARGRRKFLASLGRGVERRALAEVILREVYEVLLDVEPGDDLDLDVMTSLAHAVLEAIGGE